MRAEDALDHVAGYCVALDMTDRAAQEAAKAARRPWSAAKGWDTSLPVSREVGVNICGSGVARHDWLLPTTRVVAATRRWLPVSREVGECMWQWCGAS